MGLLAILFLLTPVDPPEGHLAGSLMRRGVRAPLVGLVIHAQALDRAAFSDHEGRFDLPLPAGRHRIRVEDPLVQPFTAEVEITAGQTTIVQWDLTPVVGVGADLTVVGRSPSEIQRTRLDTFELTHVAGTMGDPLRVLQSLPGVGTPMSLLPFPVVRGAPPGDSAYQVDGGPLPMLFHAGVGTSVIHPRLIDHVDFYPGVAPLKYGRYVGGVVDATTRKPETDGWLADLDLNLFQSGALVSAPLTATHRLTLGGRYSYSSPLISTLVDDLLLDFWDYQARFDQDLPGDSRLQITAFGARDVFGSGAEYAYNRFIFHRLTTQYLTPVHDGRLVTSLDLGADDVSARGLGGQPSFAEYLVRPRSEYTGPLVEGLTLSTGADVEVRYSNDDTQGRSNIVLLRSEHSDDIDAFLAQRATRVIGGVFAGREWRAAEGLIIAPGLRVDGYWRRATRFTADPRLSTRYAVDPATTLKTHLGLSHAPQRLFVPTPGFGEIEVDVAPISAWQAAIGVEHTLDEHWSLDITAYGTWLDNLMTLAPATFLSDEDEVEEDEVEEDEVEDQTSDAGSDVFAFGAAGRGAGLELMLRRHRADRWFGWLALTLQRQERAQTDGSWALSPLDQTLIVNAVATWQFADLWSVGTRLHYHTGRPTRLGTGRRLPDFFQADVRLDKTWIHDMWQIDLYLDVINASYQEEITGFDEDGHPTGLQYILPTLGVHAMF